MTGLNQLDLGMFDTPANRQPEPSPAPAAQDFVVKISHTKAGYPILVCTADPLPAEVIAQGQRENIPTFSGREVQLLRDCDPDLVRHILAVKREFPGASVEETIIEGRP